MPGLPRMRRGNCSAVPDRRHHELHDLAALVHRRPAVGPVQQQASILATVAAHQVEHHRLLPHPRECVYDVEVA